MKRRRMKVDLKISGKARKVMREMPGVMVPALYRGMQKAMSLAEARVRSPYLSGKALQRRSGRLRGSITHDVRIEGDRVVAHIGTSVVYGRIWELGFKGPVTVKGHTRNIRQAFGKAIKPTAVQVREHVRNLDVKPRPFIRPALKESTEKMERILSDSVMAAFGGIK